MLTPLIALLASSPKLTSCAAVASSVAVYTGWVLLFAGSLVCVLGAIGCLRFPDFYAKLHALSVIDAFGVPACLLSLVLLGGWSWISLKILAIAIVLLLGGVVSAHALIRAGLMSKEL